MRNLTAAFIVILSLLISACAPSAVPPEDIREEQPQTSPPVLPEIDEAEQDVEEIGTSDLDELGDDLDSLILP
jgi:hypothetical protein